MRVTHDEYIRIKAQITNKVREVIKVDEKPGITIRQLIDWFVEEHIDKVESEASAKELTQKVRSIIQKLINQEHELVF